MKTLVVVSMLLIPIVSPAQDVLGVYFDTEGTEICTHTSGGGDVTAYLILIDPSSSGALVFWEAWITAESVISSSEWELSGGTDMELGRAERFHVVFQPGLPIVSGESVLLATWTGSIGIYDADVRFIIGSVKQGWCPDTPCYGMAGSESGLVPLNVIATYGAEIVAAINIDCSLPAERASFGRIKALFR